MWLASIGDDVAARKLTDDLAIVQTVDYITPVLNDPYFFGQVAAANALSDIYAMGARPLNALSFVAWPVEKLGLDALGRVLEGAAAVCREAGVVISGGHSITDEEPKFGLFVTGLAHPDRIVSNAGAQAGDALVLTKPIGTGILTTAVKRGRLTADALAPAVAVMATLNRGAAEAMVEAGAHAATDVTGFGLLGHLGNMLRASSAASGSALGARIRFVDVPLFPGVAGHVAEGLCPGGTKRNLQYAAPDVAFAAHLDEPRRLLLADAQTSGGLLVAVAPSRLAEFDAALARRGVAVRAQIGRIEAAGSAGRIVVE